MDMRTAVQARQRVLDTHTQHTIHTNTQAHTNSHIDFLSSHFSLLCRMTSTRQPNGYEHSCTSPAACFRHSQTSHRLRATLPRHVIFRHQPSSPQGATAIAYILHCHAIIRHQHWPLQGAAMRARRLVINHLQATQAQILSRHVIKPLQEA